MTLIPSEANYTGQDDLIEYSIGMKTLHVTA